jgi:hypothetical protein
MKQAILTGSYGGCTPLVLLQRRVWNPPATYGSTWQYDQSFAGYHRRLEGDFEAPCVGATEHYSVKEVMAKLVCMVSEDAGGNPSGV